MLPVDTDGHVQTPSENFHRAMFAATDDYHARAWRARRALRDASRVTERLCPFNHCVGRRRLKGVTLEVGQPCPLWGMTRDDLEDSHAIYRGELFPSCLTAQGTIDGALVIGIRNDTVAHVHPHDVHGEFILNIPS